MSTTEPKVAGMFYPDDPQTLRDMIKNFLHQAQAKKNLAQPKAIIAPHAGYIYSGPIAASAYACLTQTSHIQRVVILAPAHRVYFSGIATLPTDFYVTPLGKMTIDQETLQNLDGVTASAAAFANEHALEVQLPFLQTVLSNFKIVPLLVGDTTPAMVAKVLKHLWNGEQTLIVVSSDLSHYLDYHAAQILDNKTKDAILKFDYEALTENTACGRIAIAGLLMVAKTKKMRATVVDLRNSGDTAGTQDAVVGYGAFHFGENIPVAF